MELLHPHCAGLDIHKETVVACVRHLRNGKVTTGIKTFKTNHRGIDSPLRLACNGRLYAYRHGGHRRLPGSRSGIFSPTASSNWCWPMPATSKMCRGARPTLTTPSGWPSSWPMDWSKRALCPTNQPSKCAIFCVPASSSGASTAESYSAHPEDAGGGQHQAGFGGHRCSGSLCNRRILQALGSLARPPPRH